MHGLHSFVAAIGSSSIYQWHERQYQIVIAIWVLAVRSIGRFQSCLRMTVTMGYLCLAEAYTGSDLFVLPHCHPAEEAWKHLCHPPTSSTWPVFIAKTGSRVPKPYSAHTSQLWLSAPPPHPDWNVSSLLEIVSRKAPSGRSFSCQTTSMPMEWPCPATSTCR